MSLSVRGRHVETLDHFREELLELLLLPLDGIHDLIVEFDRRVCRFEILMVQLVLQEAQQCKSLLRITLFIRKNSPEATTLRVQIKHNVDVTDLLELNLSQQAIQMNFAEVDLADRRRTSTLLHRLLRIYDIDDRVEADKLVDLLQHHLRCPISANVPHSDNLCVGAVSAADLLELKPSSRVCRPLLLLKDELIEQRRLAGVRRANHEHLTRDFLRRDRTHSNLL